MVDEHVYYINFMSLLGLINRQWHQNENRILHIIEFGFLFILSYKIDVYIFISKIWNYKIFYVFLKKNVEIPSWFHHRNTNLFILEIRLIKIIIIIHTRWLINYVNYNVDDKWFTFYLLYLPWFDFQQKVNFIITFRDVLKTSN